MRAALLSVELEEQADGYAPALLSAPGALSSEAMPVRRPPNGHRQKWDCCRVLVLLHRQDLALQLAETLKQEELEVALFEEGRFQQGKEDKVMRHGSFASKQQPCSSLCTRHELRLVPVLNDNVQ
jgi:hypothetical protein